MGSKRAHNKMQRELVDRLRDLDYRMIFQNIEYHILMDDGSFKDGELDVVASRNGRDWHYYEVKSGRHRVHKAREQFRRARDVIDHIPLPYDIATLKGVYYGADGVRRLYLE